LPARSWDPAQPAHEDRRSLLVAVIGLVVVAAVSLGLVLLTSRYCTGASAADAAPGETPAATVDAWEWQRHGTCLGYPAEVIPEERSRVGRRHGEERAKVICRGCPVLEACRDHALRTPEEYGVWGAMSASERANRSGRTRMR
jgi:WhiB family transcriptional regulator, redox-sensing transcriptional regulator